MSLARALRARPRRRENDEIRWELAEGERAAVIYLKHFGRFEGWLHKRIGGPDEIRRPLNRHTRLICVLCDGDHSVAEIVQAVDDEYGEEIAPAAERVRLFLERLLDLNLITLEPPEGDAGAEGADDDEADDDSRGDAADADGDGDSDDDCGDGSDDNDDDAARAAREASAAPEAACA